MRRYPVLLNLFGKRCLVVGAGRVGIRKIRSLAECLPDLVTVLDTAPPSAEMIALSQGETVRFKNRAFDPSDLDGVFLAVAATSDPEINRTVAELCAGRNILCNVADRPDLSSFIVPSTVRRGDLTLAISTGGASPALSKVLRRKLEEEFGEEYERLLAIMGRLRPLLIARGESSDDNAEIFRALINSPLLGALAEDDLDSVADILRETLPEDLEHTIGELLDAVS